MTAPAGGGVLLIGDIQKALLDAGQVDRYPCEVRAGLLEGIDAAVRGRFAVVGIVLDGQTHQLGPALHALREGTQVRILLLAQMHEEPIARRLVETAGDPKPADAYLVCPTCLASLCAQAGVNGRGPKGEHPAGGDPGANPQSPVHHPPSEVSLADLEQKIRHLEWLATTDDLTGLKNRRYIWEFAR